MVDVFVSYARENLAFAQRIAEGVAREGYSVWWDKDLPPHLSYGDVITETIGEAKAAIVVWSNEAARSEWVRAEADLARGQKKLIQTSIDDRMPPMPFNQIQFASIGDWKGERDHPGWVKVRASLDALCGATGAGAASAPPRSFSQPPVQPGPAARAAGGGRLAAALIGAVIVLAAIGGGLFWLRGGLSPLAGGGKAGPVEAVKAAEAPRPRVPQGATALFTQAAVIDDPDGYTNVRSGPSTGFPIVARVNQGEVFTTYPQSNAWWQVRTADSRVGYMERSRIRTIQPGEAYAGDAAPAAADQGDIGSAAAIPAADTGPAQVFPDSSRRRLTPRDLAGLSPAQIRLARNEIFARHGRPFRDPRLRRHFEGYSWYRPRPGAVALNRVELANVRLLQAAEAKP